ncbi:MAG: hypothetical protein HOW73_11625 [Polyangiaceae bacterium]|nr:hypothetical protein [Polyangiaceae bacterium]
MKLTIGFAGERGRGARVLTAVGLAVSVASAGACDILIGIEELDTPPPDEGLFCDTPSDCPATGNVCFVRACTSDHKCEVRELEPGFVPPDPTPGDCLHTICVDSQPVNEAEPNDVPSDGSVCTVESCTAEGAPQQGFANAGEVCPDGGGVCDGAGTCVQCVGPEQCDADQECVDHQCLGFGCSDGTPNGSETGLDCGGPDCPPCGTGEPCDGPADCESGVCNDTCQEPSCTDRVQNGDETDTDCGGSCVTGCGLNHKCEINDDCVSLFCSCENATCLCKTPSCDDGIQNGTEIDVDCGPTCLGTCAHGNQCLQDAWCISKVCDDKTQTCAEPSCDDGVRNGLEDGTDCCNPADASDVCESQAGCPDCAG